MAATQGVARPALGTPYRFFPLENSPSLTNKTPGKCRSAALRLLFWHLSRSTAKIRRNFGRKKTRVETRVLLKQFSA